MPSSITLTVSHLPASTSFFLSALQPLDYVYRGRVGNTIGFGTKDSPPDFWISQESPGVPAGAAHVAFPASSQKRVQEFFISALKAGGKVHGEPQTRDFDTGYYSAAVIDFDGNSIEAVYRPEVVDSSDESRPSSVSSLASVKSGKMSTKTPTVVSKASTVKNSSSSIEVRSVAPSRASTQVSKSPTQVSKAPSKAPSRAPSQVSRAPSSSSRAPSNAPSRAPSRVSSYHESIPPQTQAVVTTAPNGQMITNLVTEARGAVNVARELVNHVRPALNTSASTPAVPQTTTSDPNSHKPSDTIVGTLLGVAAGAALHYAYTKATETKSSPPSNPERDEYYNAPPQSFSRPLPPRTTTEPSLYETSRNYYYHEYQNTERRQPYAVEAPPSEYDIDFGRGASGQRYITMEDHDERLSDFTRASGRPRRRSSFSAIGSVHSVSPSAMGMSAAPSRVTQAKSTKLLEGPPTSYRAPTAITQADTHASGRSRSKSRLSEMTRSMSIGGSSRRSNSTVRRISDEDLKSRASRTTTRESRTGRSRAPSNASEARTVIPAKSTTHSRAPSRAPSKRSESKSRKPSDYPLPPSRAGTWAGSDAGTSFFSTNSKSAKTVIGKMVERDRESEGRSALTKSVVGKIEDTTKLDLPRGEVKPSDSVSQISSARGGRSRVSKK